MTIPSVRFAVASGSMTTDWPRSKAKAGIRAGCRRRTIQGKMPYSICDSISF